ncbi:threonine synthase [Salinibaculum rarum]|uniref:threonine synthase n=1 Tax=Salinibaculum rarum TaxID=3058903 RepID=UPI00265FBC7D|nr:threonine synthase [Salinibaculum sp. KK48]
MDRATAFVCSHCDEEIPVPSDHECAGPNSSVSLHHDAETVRDQFDEGGTVGDIRRYAPLLPVATLDGVTLGEGGTDLVDAPSLGADLGVDLQLKLEGANPTGSTKDRGSVVVAAHAVELGDDVVACASTGNAAASMAAYAARSGLQCCLFVPERAPDAKAVQPLVYGADVLSVEGAYDDAHDLCQRVTAASGWLDRSAGATPYTDAGARTLGYELAEQTATAPDWVVVPMGNGGTLASAWRGLETFASLGLADGTPRMLGVQAEGTAPIHDAVQNTDSEDGETCADSIDVGTPHRLTDARRAIDDSGGTTVTVSETAIRDATADLGASEGVFVEPACAAAIAGIDNARDCDIIDRGERVVAVMTGSGLKDTATARTVVDFPETIGAETDPATLARRYSSDSE